MLALHRWIPKGCGGLTRRQRPVGSCPVPGPSLTNSSSHAGAAVRTAAYSPSSNGGKSPSSWMLEPQPIHAAPAAPSTAGAAAGATAGATATLTSADGGSAANGQTAPTTTATSTHPTAAVATMDEFGQPAPSTRRPSRWNERIDVVEDEVVFKRYMTVYDRKVRFTHQDGKEHELHYDVVGHPQCAYCFAVAFPFHPPTDTRPAQVTIIREYAQGPNRLQYCLPSGGFDPRKHQDLRACALAEMREEAMLVGGEVVALLPEDHPGQSELKWSRNAFKPFLIIDPQPDPSGRCARDAEEHTIEVLRLSITELKALMHSGQMMLPSIYSCYLALDALAARGLI